MRGYVVNIEEESEDNNFFRKVLFTAQNSQLVIMSLNAGEDIGMETHGVDQFIRVEKGEGKAILNGDEHDIEDGWAVVIPAGVEHNIINTSEDEQMKLYTLYSPPEHPDHTVHETKADAEE